MSDQDGFLFDPEWCATLSEDEIQRRFEVFHAEHPEIYRHFQMVVNEAIVVRGFKRWSARAIFHVMRWVWRGPVVIHDTEDFLLNNDFSSRYARLWQSQNPEKASFFETRKLRAR